MKIPKIVQLMFVVAVLAVALAVPARAETMSVPSADKAAFTVDVPGDWKPKGDAKDEYVEAAAPGDTAYVMAWIVKADDEKSLLKDLEATLKDALKDIEGEPTEKEIDQNGTHFYVFNGNGVDKRAGNKVHFLVGIFDAGNGNAGIVYADYDADAPDSTMIVLETILKSIKVAKK
jgi:hypothetical protein